MELAATIAVWVFALVMTSGAALTLTRYAPNPGIMPIPFPAAPIVVPLIILVVAVLDVIGVARDGMSPLPGGSLVPLMWGGFMAVVWIVSALLGRSQRDASDENGS